MQLGLELRQAVKHHAENDRPPVSSMRPQKQFLIASLTLLDDCHGRLGHAAQHCLAELCRLWMQRIQRRYSCLRHAIPALLRQLRGDQAARERPVGCL